MTTTSVRPVVVHYHLFKCAGTSVEVALRGHFEDRFTTLDTGTPTGRIFAITLEDHLRTHPDVQAVSSHQLHMPLPTLEGIDVFPILFLRHPLDRILSVYRFDRRRRPITADAVLANEADLATYIRWQMQRGSQVVNVHVMRLTDAWDLETGKSQPIGPRAHLERAQATLEQIPVVGVVERYDQSASALEIWLGHWFPGLTFGGIAQNVDSSRPTDLKDRLESFRHELGDDLYEELVEMNQPDFTVYDQACQNLASVHQAAETDR